MKIISKLILVLLLVTFGCYEPFLPPPPEGNSSLLVVDGFVNSSEGMALIKLSSSAPLSSADTFLTINNASVSLADESNNEITLTAKGAGVYMAEGITIFGERQYKLKITTPDERKYESEFVPVTVAPEIDSITWSTENDHLDIKVNTHDDSGLSRYYRWTFVETWEYNAPWQSAWTVKDNTIVPRQANQRITRCWKTLPGSSLMQYSTAYLGHDIVRDFKIHSVASNSIRLSNKYSINVQQQTLTADAYHYWQNVKKTTESLGTLFDPLPAAVKGNIHCISNPEERVIGFFTAGSVTEQRIYITNSALGSFVNYHNPYCEVNNVNLELILQASYTHNILYPIYDGTVLVGWAVTSPFCSDCRIFGGGETTKPSFWND